jgi:arylsulfatase A-like enzyme
MPKPPLGSRQPPDFLTRWAAIAMALCLTDLILSAVTADGPLRLAMAPTGMRWSLLAQECGLLALVAFIPAIPASRRLRYPLALPLAVITSTGWFAYGAVGRFPGADAVGFFLTVPAQAVQHVVELHASIIPETLLTIGLLVLMIDVAAGVAEQRMPGGFRPAIRTGGFLVLAACGVGAIRGGSHFSRSPREVYEMATGVSYRTDRLWRNLHMGNAGPLSGLLLSLLPSGRNDRAMAPPDPRVTVETVPRQPGELAVEGPPAHRWNVLIVEVESMRADVLTAWGGPLRVMPTVEAIAAGSHRYLDTYSTASQTDLAALAPLSGQYPLRDVTLRAYPQRIPYPKVLIYDVLAPEGWRSAVFSSQNEEWWGMVNFLRSRSLDTLLHAGNYTGATYIPRNDLGFSRFVRNAKRSGKIDDRETVTEALKWLGTSRNTPFFLYLNLQTSHLPYSVPPDVPRRFGKGTPSFPILFGRYPVDSAEVVHDEYRNALAYVDDQIARVRAALMADGRWDSTIVVITGDHGQAFFEHPQVAGHANGVFQELVKVPLLIRAPGLTPGDDRRPASHVDVAPTIAALLGLPDQPAWQGHTLTGMPLPEDRPRFFMVQSPLAHRIGVVSGRWKMVRDIREVTTKLTDVVADPLGTVDLAPAYPDTARRLLGLLDTWRTVQLIYYGSTVTPAVQFPPRVLGTKPLP